MTELDPRLLESPDGWMLSKSGIRFWPMQLEARDVALEDIAHALACENRFGGHTTEPVSVAQHSVHVAQLVMEQTTSKAIVRAALFHDAHEAYLKDIPTMIKRAIGPMYAEAVRRADVAIGEALDIDPKLFHHELVKQADAKSLATEYRDLKQLSREEADQRWIKSLPAPCSARVVPLDWRAAKRAFYNAAILVSGPGDLVVREPRFL